MKKIALFFVIFMLFGILPAQETQSEEATVPAEEKESAEPAASAEEIPAEETAKPAEEPQQNAENRESGAQNEPAEPETAQEPEKNEPVESRPQEAAPAEEAKEESAQPQQIAAEKPKSAENPEDETPSKMFYQLSAGLGLGASIFSFRVNNDIDFLLKHTKGGTNVYLGLEVDFRYSPYIDDYSIYEIPLQLNFMFDFPLRHHNLSRIAMWFSGGIDLAFGYLSYYDYDDDDWDDGKDRDHRFKVLAAWGFGVNLLFKNDVTLKLGFDSFYGKYPDLVCVAGYRF